MDALFVVWECFKFELSVSRSALQSALIARLEDEIYALTEEDDGSPASDGGAAMTITSSSDLSSRASFLIRRLIDTQWLRLEMRGEDFENMVSLPDYAQKILDLFQSLLAQNDAEYNGLVVSCYNNLKATDMERNEYAYNALNRGFTDTQTLIDLLKGLYHNIGRYHQMTLETSDVNQLLATHFDDFQEVIVAQFLYPFKTFDSVPRFKGPILDMLNRWYQDESLLLLMAEQAKKYLNLKDDFEAHQHVMGQISGLMSMYEGLQGLIDQIDHRHNAFTRVSVEKIQYLLNRDQSMKGKLVMAIQKLHSDDISPEALSEAVIAYRQQYVETGSLYARSRIEKSRVAQSAALRVVDSDMRENAQAQFVKKVKATYGRDAVIKELMALLNQWDTVGDQLAVSSMPLENDKDFARIILASLIGSEAHAPFETKLSQEMHQVADYQVPNNLFRKKRE